MQAGKREGCSSLQCGAARAGSLGPGPDGGLPRALEAARHAAAVGGDPPVPLERERASRAGKHAAELRSLGHVKSAARTRQPG